MKDGMKGSMKRETPKKPAGKDGGWNGQSGLGTKGERHEGTGKSSRSEAAKRGFGKS